nr:DUF559 domain-containing protein [Auraticoccus cholistanensis]
MPPVVKLAALRAAGLTAAQARAGLEAAGYRALGAGWFAGPGADARVVAALRQNCRLTCATAAREHGLWVPPHSGTHVAALRTRRAPAGLVGHAPVVRRWVDDRHLLPLDLTLLHAVRCLGVPGSAVLLESAINLGLLGLPEVAALVEDLPETWRRPLLRVRRGSQSGTETVVRLWLESRHVRVQPQVQVPGVGRVNLLVGRSWVIELDSVTHHTGTEQYAEDRRRDLELRRAGYTVTRLTYAQVFHEWEATRRALEDILRRRLHRRRI